MIDLIKRLFEYDNWAIERELNILEGVDDAEALNTLWHILAAKRIWLTRLNGEDSSALPGSPNITLSDCRKLAAELAMGYAGILASLDSRPAADTITYKNTKGDEYTSTITDVLTHVAVHSAYHRGQIALLLRQHEHQAINTDFINFTRR